MADNDKLVRLTNLSRLTQGLDAKFKENLEDLNDAITESLSEKANVVFVEEEIENLEEMLGGKSIRYVTQDEYDALDEAIRDDESIAFFITDAEELKFVSELINDANYTSETKVMDLLGGRQIRYVTQAEYDLLTDKEKSDYTVLYFVTDSKGIENISELENDLDFTSESKVLEMLGGKELRYISQEEYDALPLEEKSNESIVYNIIDDDQEIQFDSIVLKSPNGALFRITVDDDGSIISSKIKD